MLGVATELAHTELLARAAASLTARPGRRLEADDLRRMVLTFHPLGTVTWDYVDRFWWEPELDPAAGGGG